MYFSDRESQLKACETYSQRRRQAAALYPIVSKVLRDFDGKIYNVRLERALQEAAQPEHIYCQKRYKFIEIYAYIGTDTFTLCQINQDDLTDGKRIPAEKMIESAQNKRESLLKEAANMDYFAANIDGIKKQLDDLKKAYNAILENIPYTAQDILNVKRMW